MVLSYPPTLIGTGAAAGGGAEGAEREGGLMATPGDEPGIFFMLKEYGS